MENKEINNDNSTTTDDGLEGVPPHSSVADNESSNPAPITPEQVNNNEPPIEETPPMVVEKTAIPEPDKKEPEPDKKESEKNGNILAFIFGGIVALMFGTK